MPTYVYRCTNCGRHDELSRPMASVAEYEPCSTCGEWMLKVFTPTPTIFRGSGWASKQK